MLMGDYIILAKEREMPMKLQISVQGDISLL